MADKTEDEDRLEKRKKWIKKLSVLSSEEEDLDAECANQERKKNVFDSNEIIGLRFPYPMFSDDSDEGSDFKYFPDVSPNKEEKRKAFSSSDDNIETSKENCSFKHTKRKHKYLMGTENKKSKYRCKKDLPDSLEVTSRKQNVYYLKEHDRNKSCCKQIKKHAPKVKHATKVKDCDTKKSLKTINKFTPSKDICRNLFHSGRDILSLNSNKADVECQKNKAYDNHKKRFPRSKRRRSSGLKDNFHSNIEGKNDNNEKEDEKPNGQLNNRFLDSSSENSNDEMNFVKNRIPKQRRVRFLSTSSSSSEEDPVKIIEQPIVNKLENTDPSEGNSKKTLCVRRNRSLSTTTEDENDSDSSYEPSKTQMNKNESNSLSVRNGLEDETTTETSNQKSQIKPTVNTNAWRNIAIADIKCPSKNQSRVEELRRKLVTSNAPSVAIYRKIQNREMCKKKPEVQKQMLRPHNNHHRPLHDKEANPSPKRVDGTLPITSKNHKETLTQDTQKTQLKENSDTININSSSNSVVVEREDTEHADTNVGQSQSNLECSIHDAEDIRTSIYGKKVRYAHDRRLRDQNGHSAHDHQTSNCKLVNQTTKNVQSSYQDKMKESKQISNETSSNCDVLGNIMSQMDNNRYKLPKPVVKKAEQTPDMLGWFPSGANASALIGQTQTINTQTVNIGDFLLKNNLPAGGVSATSSVGKIDPNLSSIVINNNNKQMATDRPSRISKNKDSSQQKASSISKPSSEVSQQTASNFSKLSSGVSQQKASNTSKPCSEVIIPFYSAPQDDYKNKEAEKGSNNDAPVIHQNSSLKFGSSNQNFDGNNKADTIHRRKSNDCRAMLGKNEFVDKESRSKISNTDVRSNECSLVACQSEGSLIEKIIHESLSSGNSKTEKENPSMYKPDIQIKKSVNDRPLPTQTSLGFPKSNEVTNELRNKCMDSRDNSKGLRVRFGGTEFTNNPSGVRVRWGGKEFRATPKLFIPNGPFNVANRNYLHHQNKSADTPKSTSVEQASISKCITSTAKLDNKSKPQQNKVIENVTNEKKTSLKSSVSMKTKVSSNSSSSSTTSSSSRDDSSSSSESCSSFESSDESDKPISTEGSTSGSADLRVESPLVIDENKLYTGKSDSLPQTQDLKPNLFESKNRPTNNLAKGVPKCLNKNTSEKIKNKENIKEIRTIDVITLSGSSDSDGNDQQSDKVVTSKIQERTVSQCKDNSNKEKTLNKENDLVPNSSKVGKIRVKSLKELGVTVDKPITENALQPQPSELTNNGLQNFQPEAPSSSASASVGEHEELISEKTNPSTSKQNVSKQVLGQSNNREGQIFQNLTRPPNTIFLPIGPIAIITPIQSLKNWPSISSTNQLQNTENHRSTTGVDTSQGEADNTSLPRTCSSETASSGSTQLYDPEINLNQNSSNVTVMPRHCTEEEAESLFFKLCDEFFTDTVIFKIPEMVDTLHLIISYDIMKEERLKKIEQLISQDTIFNEKRRAEKEFADTIKIRGQKFVPLFMTIVNKIGKDNLKALITALYCRIIHELERIDSNNSRYRFKIRNIIKCMLQKHSCPKNILSYFDENNTSFLSNFIFIDNLLKKYDKYVEGRQQVEVQNQDNENELSNNDGYLDIIGRRCSTENNVQAAGAEASQAVQTTSSEMNKKSCLANSTPAKPPLPPIGGLDKLFCKTPRKK